MLEEGLSADDLRAEVEAIAAAAATAGVEIVAGDTKVVERGSCDSMYVTTTGLGRVDPRASLSTGSLRPGDRILVSGPIGDHGTAVMLARGEFELEAPVESDTRSLWPAVDALLDAAGPSLRCLRDATRGGVASALNELARRHRRSRWSCARRRCRSRPPVAGACEMLGIDPMYVANEGVLVAFVAPEAADAALDGSGLRARLRRRGGDRRSEDGARRHGARRDRFRRPAGDGSPRRRSVAPNLLGPAT